MGRLCGVEYHDGTFEQYAYNKDGLLVEARNPNSHLKIKRDRLGRIQQEWQDGHAVESSYDETGRIHRHTVTARGRETRRMRYQWGTNDRLTGIVNELTDRNTWFDYDTMGNLTGSTFNETEKLFRVPDAVGNLYKASDRKDRKYGPGGRLLETGTAKYHYDEEGNLGARWKAGKSGCTNGTPTVR